MSNYPNVYGFCDAGCKRQTMSKEEIEDKINGLTSKLIIVTGQTVIGGGNQPLIQLTSDEFINNTLIELFGADNDTRNILFENANTIDSIPSSAGDIIYIPLMGAVDVGVNVKFIVRINYSTEITGKVIHLHI